MPPQQVPPIGANVTDLMPKVGEDVTALMGGAPPPAAQPASMWDSVYNFLTTPQAPEMAGPAAEQHPWVAEAYNRFVRPISSPVGAAVTGITSAVGGPLLRAATAAAPRAVGAGLTGVGVAGGAQAAGDVADISREGFTPQNTMALLEHGTMAAAALPGGAMMAGKLGGKPRVPAPKAATPELPPPAAVLPEKPMLPTVGNMPKVGEVVQPSLFEDIPARNVGSAAEVPTSRAIDVAPSQQFGVRQPQSVAQAEKIATVMGDEIPVAKPIEQRKLVEDSMARRMPQEQRDDFLKVIDENDGFQAQRRDVQPVERTKGIARYLEVEKEKLAPGSIRNAEETTAVANALATVNDKIGTLAAKVADGTANDFDKGLLLKARGEQAVLTANYLGIRAEQGRALNMHKQLAQIVDSGDIDMIRKALQAPGVKDMDPETFAKEWVKLPDDKAKLDWLRSQQTLTRTQKAQAVFYANILSGIKTSLRNVFGTGANALFREASFVPAVGYDIIESKLLGRPREMFMGEVAPSLQGAVIGLKQGWQNAMFTLQHGYTPRMLSQFDVPRPELGPLGIGKAQLGKTPAANPFNWPGRVLEAEDAMMFEPIYNKELFGRLFTKAEKMGLTGAKRDAQMAEWKLNPPADVKDAAEKAAASTLFREEPGKIANWLMDGKKKIPQLGFLMPFVKIPANIMRQSVEAMPGGAFVTAQGRAALRAGGRERAEAVGRMVAGTSALGLLAYWATQGKLSGAGPSDPRLRADLMESGWKPNSVKVGDKWIDYQIPFQSIAIPLAAVANAWEQYHKDGKAPDLGHLLASIGGSALDQSFLSGVSDLNAALNDPERSGARYAARVAQSAVPFSGLSRNVAQAVDPVVREAGSTGQSVQSIVPGLSQNVPPKLSRFGEPVERPGGPLQRGFSPVTISTESDDKLIKELGRLKITSIGLPPKTLDATKNPPMPKIELTTDERQQIGRAVRTGLERLMSNPSWQQIPDDAARDMVARTVQQVRTEMIRRIRTNRRGQ